MPNRDTRGCRYHPANVLSIPHLDVEGEVVGDVVQVGIGQLSKQSVNPEVRLRRSAPEAFAFAAQLFE
jgi:hypothetical protein